MPRVFISYSRVDETFARRLATSLSDMGADVWIDIEDIPAGMKWSSAIQEGLDTANILIVIISPESMASRNVEDEWQYYLDHAKPVIPLLLRPAKIHFQLNRIQYIDFLNQDYDRALVQLHAELDRKGVKLSLLVPEGATASYDPSVVNQKSTRATPDRIPTPAPSGGNRNLYIGGGVVLFVAIIAIILLILLSSQGGDGTDEVANHSASQTAAVQVAQATTAPTTMAPPTAIPTTIAPTTIPTTVAPTTIATTVAPTIPVMPGIDTAITDNNNWTVVERTINGVPMVLVPRGTVNLGVSESNYAANLAFCRTYPGFNESSCTEIMQDELNQQRNDQRINLEPFWIDKYEVSNQLYYGRGGELPVTDVTWRNGQSHCSSRDRLTRLPTEPEWEYAAKGPSGWRFPWGNELDTNRATANICDDGCRYQGNTVGWEWKDYDDGFNGIAPVNALPDSASWVGALNMGGNVWEYTSTIFASLPYSDASENPRDTSSNRTLRGSSWQWVMFEATTSSRAEHYSGGETSDFYGFRCVRDYQDGDLERYTP